MNSFLNNPPFETIESRLCREIMGLSLYEALSIIRQNDCISFVEKEDKRTFEPVSPTAHSYRIKLTVLKGKIINSCIG